MLWYAVCQMRASDVFFTQPNASPHAFTPYCASVISLHLSAQAIALILGITVCHVNLQVLFVRKLAAKTLAQAEQAVWAPGRKANQSLAILAITQNPHAMKT